MNAVIVMQGDPDLLEMVSALGAIGGRPHPLHGGQRQGDQNSDNGDHYQ